MGLPAGSAASPDVKLLMIRPIPREILSRACAAVGSLPVKTRGIRITRELIQATMEILNAAPLETLPQNSRNTARKQTPDSLDRRIKEYLDTDLRTANIISVVLEEAGVVKVVKVVNPPTGRNVKGTTLLPGWTW